MPFDSCQPLDVIQLLFAVIHPVLFSKQVCSELYVTRIAVPVELKGIQLSRTYWTEGCGTAQHRDN